MRPYSKGAKGGYAGSIVEVTGGSAICCALVVGWLPDEHLASLDAIADKLALLGHLGGQGHASKASEWH